MKYKPSIQWVRILSKDGKSAEFKIVEDLADINPGYVAAPVKQLIYLLHVNLYESPIVPKFELVNSEFRITYLDAIVFPRQVGIILIRGTPVPALKTSDKISFKLIQKVKLVGRDPDDTL